MLGPFTFMIFRRPKANLNPTIPNKKGWLWYWSWGLKGIQSEHYHPAQLVDESLGMPAKTMPNQSDQRCLIWSLRLCTSWNSLVYRFYSLRYPYMFGAILVVSGWSFTWQSLLDLYKVWRFAEHVPIVPNGFVKWVVHMPFYQLLGFQISNN
jgi:hypothetical protein